MNTALSQVFCFMSKHHQPIGAPLREVSVLASTSLNYAAIATLREARQLLKEAEHAHKVGLVDSRVERAHLILEEVGELCCALRQCDMVKVSDAITDLLYVVLGTAITFNIPIVECFEEVHRSNMTKTPTRDAGDTLLKRMSKGPDYSPPNLEKVLKAFSTGDNTAQDGDE